MASQYPPLQPEPLQGMDAESNIDPDQVHLVVTVTELDILVDALRSVGNTELADRYETILRRFVEGRNR